MALSLLSLSVSDCSSLLPASRIAEIDHAIATHPVTLLGMAHMRCTDAALQRLEGAYGRERLLRLSELLDRLGFDARAAALAPAPPALAVPGSSRGVVAAAFAARLGEAMEVAAGVQPIL